MRQNASGGQLRPSLPNGPTTNSLPSPHPSLHPSRPHLGPHRSPCPPQPLANGPLGPGTHRHSDSLSAGDSTSSSNSSSINSSSNNQPGPTATGPNGDVPYLQPAGSGDTALLPHTCTSTQTQDAAPHRALHLTSSQVRHHPLSLSCFSTHGHNLVKFLDFLLTRYSLLPLQHLISWMVFSVQNLSKFSVIPKKFMTN